MKPIRAWAIKNKSGIGFVTCESKTILTGKKCMDYIIHTSKKNAQRDFDEIYDPSGLKIVRVEIREISKESEGEKDV